MQAKLIFPVHRERYLDSSKYINEVSQKMSYMTFNSNWLIEEVIWIFNERTDACLYKRLDVMSIAYPEPPAQVK